MAQSACAESDGAMVTERRLIITGKLPTPAEKAMNLLPITRILKKAVTIRAAVSITWPAFIRHGHCDELEFIATETQWRSTHAAKQYLPDDLLVDSTGNCFQLSAQGTAEVLLSLPPLSLDEVLCLVRSHAALCGQCCVSKMGAPDIASAVALVGEIE